jgi:hypothetical protein
MKKILALLILLSGFSASIASSRPLGATIQTSQYDPLTGLVTVRILNTSQKAITAFTLAVVTQANGQVNHYEWMRDFLNNAAVIERFKGTPDEQRAREVFAPDAIAVGGYYDEKIPVAADNKDFSATVILVVYADKTAETTDPEAAQRMADQRKSMATSIEKANQLLSTASDPKLASTQVENLLNAWKATPHHELDMDESALRSILRDLEQNPDLKSYVAAKEKEKAMWADQAKLVVTGGQP